MFGYAPDEAMGRALNVGESTPDEDRERMRRLMAGEKFSYDARSSTRSGTGIDIQVAVAPLLNDANQCIGSIAVARDVTQHKRSEEALRLAREAAEAANHAKSSFLARMSHEIRTPMNGVLGMTELLLETGLSSTQRMYAETVQRSGQNLLGIINDLLDFSKIEAGKLELETVDMDLRRAIEDIVDLLAERAHAKGLELAYVIPPDLQTHLRGDPLRLGQVLTNLVGNAIKFTDQGSVVIRVTSLDETARNIRMRFDVIDTGVGIRRDAQSRIFEEFSQGDGSTTRKHGGSGLGLAISKQLVEMMGGSVHVDSAPGVGSTFWFTSTFEKQELPPNADPRSAPMLALTGMRALIVESNTVNRGILHSQLSSWGMANRVAATPDQAIETLRKAAARGAPFDIAIIDLGIPGMDALELARAIRARADIAKVRLVLLTRRQADIRNASESGINACLSKPVRQSVLYNCLVNVMAGRPQEEIAMPAVSEPMNAAPPGTRGSILLVEDNLINQQVALGILQILGYSVSVVSNGREALDACTQGTFDLILMDCHMPEMDGFEATKAIRARELASNYRRVPIIALTANAMAHDREECLSAGMDDHLSKPFNTQTLQAMLARWMASRESAGMQRTELVEKASDNDAGVLDRRVLDELARVTTNGRPELLANVIDLYLVESPKLLLKLSQAAKAGDAPEIVRMAHSLKSSSANVGAMALSRYCEQAEKSARRADIEEARLVSAEIAAEHGRVQAALAAEAELLTPARV